MIIDILILMALWYAFCIFVVLLALFYQGRPPSHLVDFFDNPLSAVMVALVPFFVLWLLITGKLRG